MVNKVVTVDGKAEAMKLPLLETNGAIDKQGYNNKCAYNLYNPFNDLMEFVLNFNHHGIVVDLDLYHETQATTRNTE